ncbi:MAG: M48 family peptidase [Bacteroidetes bacterium HGW-Bacteroidetes-12]|nr:MAG: M48 family peptidase [Bacteroidetes bacterium HGW-Bacteroidetes-12]
MAPKNSLFSTTYNFPDVGNILFRRNLRAKRLTITIRPKTGVRVTIPGLLPFKTAKNFVEDKKDWINDKLKELSTKVEKQIIIKYRTKNHELILTPVSVDKIKIILQNGLIEVQYPNTKEISDVSVQEAAKKAIEMAFRKEALEILPARVNELADKYGFNYNDLRIKKISSRWGSCSANDNINLSIYLMKLPDDLIDYIIIHELTHTIHKNHGPKFWSHLNKLTGDAKGLSARVKKYRTGI